MSSWKVTYRGKGGQLESLFIAAETRAGVFVQLKAKGISAVKIEEQKASGKSNVSPGEAKALKYGLAATALLIAGVAAMIIWRTTSSSVPAPKKSQPPTLSKKNIQDSIVAENSASTQTVPPVPIPEFQIQSSRTSSPAISSNKVSYSADDMLNQARARGKRQIFRHQSDIWFSHFITPGVRVPPIPVNGNLKDSFIASLTDPIAFNADDTESERAAKEEVANMRKQASEWIRNGGTFESYMTELESRQQREADRMDVAREVLLNNFKEDEDPQSTIDLWNALNKKLEEDGLRPMSLPAPIRIRLAKQGIKIKEQ